MHGIQLARHGRCGCGDGNGGNEDDRRVAEGEEKPSRAGSLSLLRQLASHIVDGRDMIGIEGMAETEQVGQKGRAQKCRPLRERCPRPGPTPPHLP